MKTNHLPPFSHGLDSLWMPFLLALGCAFTTNAMLAATLWSGPDVTFTKPNGSDGTLAQNQDRMTPNVWIARDQNHGLYNAKTETFFTHFFSPQGTEWANGSLANFSSLTYTDWNSWAKGVNAGPPSTVGVNAVVHLIAEDIYLSIRFTSWGGSAGGFSYVRSSPAPTAPPPPTITGTTITGNGAIRFTFTSNPGLTFSILSSTDASAPISNWAVAGTSVEGPAGVYTFTQSTAGASQKFYRVRFP